MVAEQDPCSTAKQAFLVAELEADIVTLVATNRWWPIIRKGNYTIARWGGGFDNAADAMEAARAELDLRLWLQNRNPDPAVQLAEGRRKGPTRKGLSS
jgi:hypothetical protein